MSSAALNPRQFWGEHPEEVRVDALMRHREYDHGPGYTRHAITRQEYAPKRTPAEWQAFVDDIRSRGVQQPVRLNYSPETGHAYIGEGNSRLAAAYEAGRETVPVIGFKNNHVDPDPHYKIPGTHQLGDGHFPQDFRVSGVLPREYMQREPQREAGE